MKPICIVVLIVIVLFSGCTNKFMNQIENPQLSDTTTDGTLPSSGSNTIVTSPTEIHTGHEPWKPESGGVYDISSMIMQQGQYRIDYLISERNVMIYSDALGGNTMAVPYDLGTLKLETESAYTLPAGVFAETYINHDVIYTTERDYKTREWIVKAYVWSNGQLVNTIVTKDSLGYTCAKNSILLFCTEENQQRIYLKNLINGNEDTLLIWDTSDKFSKPIISDIIQSENGFAFIGNIYTSNSSQSVLCCGFIDRQGNLLTLNMYNDEHQISICDGGILVQDDFQGFDSKYDPEGKYHFYDVETFSIKMMDAQDPRCKIFISSSGKILIAALIDEEVCSMWVYDLVRGECSNIFSYQIVDIQVSQYSISISEKENGFYLLLKGKSENQLIYFGL